MTIERLRDQIQAEPFRRFTIHLADGRDVEVHHREFIAFSASGRTIVVFQPDDRMNIIDLLHVTDLEVLPETKKRKNGNGRGKH